MNTPLGQYEDKGNPHHCGSFARYIKTNVCVRCAIGRKEAAYERMLLRSKPSKAQVKKASSEQAKLNIKKQLNGWAIEDAQKRQESDRMFWEF